MKYTVVVKEIISSNGDYKKQRFNNVSQKIFKYLIKHNFSFMVGIYKNVINNNNYIEIYKKFSGALGITLEQAISNDNENKKLIEKLRRY